MFESFVRVVQIPLRPFIHIIISGSTRTRAVIICQEEVLLIRGWLGSQRWSLPGGGLKKGEKPERGMTRELHEELGVVISQDQLKHLKISKQEQNEASYTAMIFSLQLPQKPVLKIRKTEIIETKWFQVSELPENLNPVVKEALGAWKN